MEPVREFGIDNHSTVQLCGGVELALAAEEASYATYNRALTAVAESDIGSVHEFRLLRCDLASARDAWLVDMEAATQAIANIVDSTGRSMVARISAGRKRRPH